MEYTTLGKSELNISRICLGLWQASGWSTSDDKQILNTIHAALDSGITFFDTAEAYGDGHSEQLLGRALKAKRQDVVIATKFPFNKARPEQIRKSVERSLRRLQTDYIDLYQQHWPPKQPALNESIDLLKLLQQEGKIREIGVCNWMEPEWEEFGAPEPIVSLQPCYSLLWRTIEANVLPFCREHSLAVIPYSPLCQGLLTGRFSLEDAPPPDIRSKNRLFQQELFPKALRVVDEVRSIAQDLSKTVSQVALRWLLEQPGVTAPIVGASKPDQIRENVGACGWALSPEHCDRLSEVSAELSAEREPYDTLWGWHSRA